MGCSVGKTLAVSLKGNLMVPIVLFEAAAAADAGGGIGSSSSVPGAVITFRVTAGAEAGGTGAVSDSVSRPLGMCTCSLSLARLVMLSERDLFVPALLPDVALEVERERFIEGLP